MRVSLANPTDAEMLEWMLSRSHAREQLLFWRFTVPAKCGRHALGLDWN